MGSVECRESRGIQGKLIFLSGKSERGGHVISYFCISFFVARISACIFSCDYCSAPCDIQIPKAEPYTLTDKLDSVSMF